MTSSPTTRATFVKLFVRDFQPAVEFLGEVLGLPEMERFTADEDGRIVHEALFGAGLESSLLAIVAVAYEDGDVPPASNAIIPEVHVADVGAVLERARTRGFRVAEEATGADGARLVYTREGHPFAILADQGGGPEAVAKVTGVRMMVADLERNLTFAEKALGLQLARRDEESALFEGRPGLSIGSDRQQTQAPTGATYLGLMIGDVESVMAATCELGGHIQRGIKPSGGGPVDVNSAVLVGIEGHRIEVAELVRSCGAEM